MLAMARQSRRVEDEPLVEALLAAAVPICRPRASKRQMRLLHHGPKHAKKMLRDFGPGDLWLPFQHAATAADVDSIYTAAAAARPVLGHAII